MNLVICHDGTILRIAVVVVVSVHIFGIEKTIYIYIYISFLVNRIAIQTGNNYGIELDEIMYIDGNYT